MKRSGDSKPAYTPVALARFRTVATMLLGCVLAILLWLGFKLVLDESTSTARRVDPDFEATIPGPNTRSAAAPAGMVWIPGGEFSMGCIDPRGKPHGGPDAMLDARPIHRVHVNGFWIDRTEVTNAQFREFVEETGYVTVAERPPRAEDFPGAPPENLVPGGLVFTPPAGPVSLGSYYAWWAYVPGADWRHPLGPQSSIEGHDDDPVVQVAYDDAMAFAAWAKKRLPTEAEWEFAARGGLSGSLYTWGDEFLPGGRFMANTWQGRFPAENTAADGYVGSAPVGRFPPNGYGVHDMSGNVWEWCADWYRPDTYASAAVERPSRNPTGPPDSFDPQEPDQKKRILRGGSFLCSELYCARYIVGTRGKAEPSSGASHIGFRCVQPQP